MSMPSICRLKSICALIIALGVLGLFPRSAQTQTPSLSLSGTNVNVTWPLTNYYYLLQTTTNLADANGWYNLATASALSSVYSYSIPPQTTINPTAPVITNVVGDNFVVTQGMANVQQFFRLQAPQPNIGIPVCSFMVFYVGLLEFSDAATLTINGPVHSNEGIDLGAPSGVTHTFDFPLTTTGTIGWPERMGIVYVQGANTIFKGQPPYVTNLPSFHSLMGTNNPHVMIDIPPTAENPSSALGQSRLFNNAQVILIVSNSPSTITSGTNPAVYVTLQNSASQNLPALDPAKLTYILTNVTTAILQTNANTTSRIALPFLSLTNTFYDQRESATTLVSQIDMGAFRNWALTNPIVTAKMPALAGDYPTILYVADKRNITNKLVVVRLINGMRLPANNSEGFTVATPNPLYVWGNYNVTQNGTNFALSIGSTTNGYNIPAALMADAITVLSSNWADALSKSSYTTRVASSMTINAAMIAGNVPSTGTSATTFSGGVNNLTRLLENWSGPGTTLTYNTSLICLYSSQMATNQFQPPGYYYEPPTRIFGFDPNFNNPTKIPPGIPLYSVP